MQKQIERIEIRSKMMPYFYEKTNIKGQYKLLMLKV